VHLLFFFMQAQGIEKVKTENIAGEYRKYCMHEFFSHEALPDLRRPHDQCVFMSAGPWDPSVSEVAQTGGPAASINPPSRLQISPSPQP
jgi:hypothetical protein